MRPRSVTEQAAPRRSRVAVTRRFLLTGALGLAALLAAAGCDEQPAPQPSTVPVTRDLQGTATVTPLANDMWGFNSDRTGNFEVFTMKADGSQQKQITNDASFDSWWARVSPDRQRILFYRSPKGVHDRDYGEVTLWMMNADGSDQRMLLGKGAHGWEQHGHAEWSPDGARLVMFGGSRMNPQIFITDAEGQNPRQITNSGGTNLDPSWSPDGKTVVYVGCPSFICFEKDYEIFTVPAAGGDRTRLTSDQLRDHDPYYSPDGSQIAWLVESLPGKFGPVGAWDIFLMDADGGNQRKLTSDGQINSKAHWSLDGQWIYFHRFAPGPNALWAIYRIKPDGAGLTAVTTGVGGNNEYPSN